MIITLLRKNIGTIVAAFGFVLLCIMTFGDLGELMSDQYWENVRENITSISFMSISLTLVQTAIRQGLAEQALQRGLNTENAQTKYNEHRTLIKDCTERLIYLPYFLQIYNKRHTKIKKHEFLINNNYTSEKSLYQSGRKRLIRKYDKVVVHITASRIKWATTDIVYNRQGQIMSLQEHRNRRVLNAVLTSLAFMIGITFITRGLFFTPSEEPIWQKFVKLLSYIIAIAMSSFLAVIKEYEKGAFGVPNELDEINEIWTEFINWEAPQWVLDEVERLNTLDEEVNDEQAKERETASECRRDVQEEQKESESVCDPGADRLVFVPCSNDRILSADE